MTNIYFPQKERNQKLDFRYIPETEKEFYGIITKAPKDILIGMGFRIWDDLFNIIKENQKREKARLIFIPIINSNKKYGIEIGRKDNHPIKKVKENKYLWLFPKEWYSIIPNGFEVVGLYGEKFNFEKNISSSDSRFGCLAYGILKKSNF